MKALRKAAAIIGTVATVVSYIPGPWQGPARIVAAVATVASAALAIADKSKPSQTGSPTTFDARADGPIPYVMGRTATAGKLVYWKEHGSPSKTPNDRQTFVTVLSGAGPIEGHERFDVDQAPVTFDASSNAIGFYHGYMWMTTQLGLTPSPHLNHISGEGTPAPGWTPQHLLSGYAAAMWTLVFDSKKGKYYQNGTPPALWVMKGVRVYDPRQDSTFPGGSGPCRAGVESTYVYAGVVADRPAGENPFLHALTWIIGRLQNGQRILGIGAPVIGIDIAAFVEGANVCDANDWRIGGVAYSTDNKWDTLVNILQAGGGTPLALGAKISCTVSSPKVALDTIRVGDLSGGVTVAATPSRRDRINTITPRCRLEEQFWEPVPLAPVSVPDYFAVDGGPRSKEVPYTFVQQTKQAAQLARYDIENAREFGPISLPLRPRWMGYKPGDCLTVILPEVGLDGQKVMLSQRSMDPGTGLPVMTAQSETDGKHSFALGQTTVAPPTPSVAVRVQVPQPSGAAWSVAGADDGQIVVTGLCDDPNADGIVFEYRNYVEGAAVDANWRAAGVEPPATVRKVIAGISPDTLVQIGISYREGQVIGPRLVLGPLTSAKIVAASIVNQGPWATTSTTVASVTAVAPNLLYNGGLSLRGAGFSYDPAAWSFFFGQNGEGFLAASGVSGTRTVASQPIPCVPGTYTVQALMFAGGVSAGSLNLDVQYYNSSNVLLNSPRVSAVNGTGWAPYSLVTQAPPGTTYAIVRWFTEAATNNNAAIRRIKLANLGEPTNFTDEATNSAIYRSTGQEIDSLRPAEVGANVTETKVAAAIIGQGSGATANNLQQLDPAAAQQLAAAAGAQTTVKIGVGTSSLISRSLPGGGSIFISGVVKYNVNSSQSGTGKISIQVAPGGTGSFTEVASGTTPVGSDGPGTAYAEGYFTNNMGSRAVFDIRAIVTAVGQTGTDPTYSFLTG